MRRDKREPISPFGASLLDMMTCALGATILLFIIKTGVQTQDAGDLRGALENAARAMALADAAERDANAASGRLQARVRSVADQTAFGLPRIEGNLALVIDASGSMNGTKVTFAMRVVESLMSSSPLIASVRASIFNEETTVVLDWQPVSAAVPRAIEDALHPAGKTNVLGALQEAMTALRLRGGGSVVLVSDGLQNHPTEMTTNEILNEINFHQSIKIHTLGLFGATDSAALLGNLLRAISLEGRGEFVAFVTEERELHPLVAPVRMTPKTATASQPTFSTSGATQVDASDDVRLPTYDGTAVEHQRTPCEQLRIEVHNELFADSLTNDELAALREKLATCNGASQSHAAMAASYLRPADIEESFPTRFDL